MSTPAAKLITPRFAPPSRAIGSAQTSPATHSMATVGSHSLTHSSVSGNYVYLTVQVTRDLQPVAYAQWRLPEDAYDLGVADVTLEQFANLSRRLGRGFTLPPTPVSLSDLHTMISRSMASLSDLLKVRSTKPWLYSRLTHKPGIFHRQYPPPSGFVLRSRIRHRRSGSSGR